MGVGMIVALVVDASIIRVVLVPATMKLMAAPIGGRRDHCVASTSGSDLVKAKVPVRRIRVLRPYPNSLLPDLSTLS